MVTGWLAWTCLLLAPHGSEDVFYMNQREFKIPIRIAPDRQADVKKLILYCSKDEGKSWGIYAQATADKKEFPVYTQTDGPMWFNIAVIDQSDRQDPPDPYRAAVGQKLFIDTVKPEVRITSAERIGNEIEVHWEVRELHPDWTTLRLDYRMGDTPGGQPVPLAIESSDHGIFKFKVNVPGPVTLRLQLKDLAGNEGMEEKLVPADRGMQDRTTADRGVTDRGMTDRGVVGASAVEPSITRTVSPGSQSGFDHGPVTSTALASAVPSNSGTNSSLGSVSSAPGGSSPGGVVALPGGANSGPIAGGSASRLALPPLRIVNKKVIKLDFEVSEYGPSGVGSVDVYVTTDEGGTWELTKPEPGSSLPVSGEARGTGPLLGSVSVLLPKDETIYGFYLVIKNRAGLGQDPPRSGDTPQLRVERDTTPPKAEMYAPQPEPTKRDALLLSWWAEDRNMATNPVSVEWAAQRDGPWEFIGEPQLPNTGKFSWQVPAKIPPKVYLRLTVRDSAGNTAIAQTPEPVLIDLRKPVLGAIKVDVGTR